MAEFILDRRLHSDCHLIAQTDRLSYLLHRNAEVVWFILVPHTDQIEFYQLEASVQNFLCSQINLMSGLIKTHFDAHKINVATIGNVVSQMHIHVIGRREDDAYWPDVVWGKTSEKHYEEKQLSLIKEQLIAFLKL